MPFIGHGADRAGEALFQLVLPCIRLVAAICSRGVRLLSPPRKPRHHTTPRECAAAPRCPRGLSMTIFVAEITRTTLPETSTTSGLLPHPRRTLDHQTTTAVVLFLFFWVSSMPSAHTRHRPCFRRGRRTLDTYLPAPRVPTPSRPRLHLSCLPTLPSFPSFPLPPTPTSLVEVAQNNPLQPAYSSTSDLHSINATDNDNPP